MGVVEFKLMFLKIEEGTGVMAIFIGTDTVEGVAGTGIGIAFGVLFSSSTTVVAVLEGVVNGTLLSDSVLCNFSLCLFCSSVAFATLDFEDTLLEEMGEKGCRSRGDSMI